MIQKPPVLDLAELLQQPVLQVAEQLLGCVITSRFDDQTVSIRLTEVEAYDGDRDPGSHAYRGQTPRNSSMFLSGGHLYVYRSYGIHWCANVVCGPAGKAGGLLMRAGEVVSGIEVARKRRQATGVLRSDRDLARGPGRLGAALGMSDAVNGTWLLDGGVVSLHAPTQPVGLVGISTRTGVAGTGAPLPYRYYLADDPTVSSHRPHADASR